MATDINKEIQQMIPKECKRIAEVDFPIAEVSKHSAAEGPSRTGHPWALHKWWARRPMAACRAMLMALLLPDPVHKLCPDDFKAKARNILPELVGTIKKDDLALRKALLKFIADFANWDNSTHPIYLKIARGLIKAAHPEEPPLVVDPFAGGGSIPLEALRIGCETFASDLNPVACLILKVMLNDIPRHGPELSEELSRVGAEIKKNAEKDLAELYPVGTDGDLPIVYLWARSVKCESPNCGAEIPLMRSFWISKKANRMCALRHEIIRHKHAEPRVEFEVFHPKKDSEVVSGTVSRAKAKCLCCGSVLLPDRVRTQLSKQKGGADVIFDSQGRRLGGARLLTVVTMKPGEQGRHYRLATDTDYKAVWKAQQKLGMILDKWEREGRKGPCPIPDEATPVGGGSGAGRAFSVQKYGMMTWGDLFTARQKVALLDLGTRCSQHTTEPVLSLLALALDKVVLQSSASCRWKSTGESLIDMFGRNALPIVWDFAESIPSSNSAGSFVLAVEAVANVARTVAKAATKRAGQIQSADACASPLPDASSNIWFTDPPYYDAIPYSDLSDCFLVWLHRILPHSAILVNNFENTKLSPKYAEIVQDEARILPDGTSKDRSFFEHRMALAFAEGRRVLREGEIGSVVFAHKTTEGWEALLSGMTRGGWTITGSWPIATELGSRLRAHDSASLATSIHLVCRPRPEDAPVGDWGDVHRELPGRVGDWMERLQGEGVRGADLVFACIGPALEIYSRYSKVMDANDNPIPLGGDPEAEEPHKRGYLSYVWEAVGRAALEQVLGTAEAKARNSAAGALEEDARLTALFLWTLQSTESKNNGINKKGQDKIDLKEDEDEEQISSGMKPKGYPLIYDVVRRFAQPLGIHLPEWEDRIIKTEKGVVYLLPIAERAKQLFGEDSAQAVADRIESSAGDRGQIELLLGEMAEAAPRIKGGRRGKRKTSASRVSDKSLETRREATTLDRVHAAMLLQRGGRANALRALIKAERQRGPDFERLANSLSALYPKGSEEKRLLEAMLQAMPR